MAGALSEIAFRAKVRSGAVGGSAAGACAALPRSAYGTTLAHFGVGLTVVGIIATSAYQSESILVMKPGERVEIAGYELNFLGATPRQGAELHGACRRVRRDARRRARRHASNPTKRIYDAPPQPTTEARHPLLAARRSPTSCSVISRPTAAMPCGSISTLSCGSSGSER